MPRQKKLKPNPLSPEETQRLLDGVLGFVDDLPTCIDDLLDPAELRLYRKYNGDDEDRESDE
jgi:hypothetical protein